MPTTARRQHLGIGPEVYCGVWVPYERWEKWYTNGDHFEYYQHTRASWAWCLVINTVEVKA